MNIFDSINEDLFRPLTGINKRRYVDVLTLLWDKCKRMPMYAVEKSTIIDEVENYFIGLDENITLDELDRIEEDSWPFSADNRDIATFFLRRLRNTGWIDEKDGEYEEESRLAINYKVVPILKSFNEVTSPKLFMYKGKLFKIYTLLSGIDQQANPYETVLKEVSEDLDELNQSLRQLAASIEEHIDVLTQGKRPQEVLDFFENYEERIVVGAYHRFKTNDNLFYYRTSLYEALDVCEDNILNALIADYMEVERKEETDSKYEIKKLIRKIRDDVGELEEIMRVIDNKHILYRTRAVQRAQFLLLSDGSIKSKINTLLQYYSMQITEKEDMEEYDDTAAKNMFQIYSQNYYAYESLAAPAKKRESTPIELMGTIEALNMEKVNAEQKRLLEYARNALTSENVNNFAKKLLDGHNAVSAGNIFEKDIESIIKIIGLYTYSHSSERVFDIILKDQYVIYPGIKFRDFIVSERTV